MSGIFTQHINKRKCLTPRLTNSAWKRRANRGNIYSQIQHIHTHTHKPPISDNKPWVFVIPQKNQIHSISFNKELPQKESFREVWAGSRESRRGIEFPQKIAMAAGSQKAWDTLGWSGMGCRVDLRVGEEEPSWSGKAFWGQFYGQSWWKSFLSSPPKYFLIPYISMPQNLLIDPAAHFPCHDLLSSMHQQMDPLSKQTWPQCSPWLLLHLGILTEVWTPVYESLCSLTWLTLWLHLSCPAPTLLCTLWPHRPVAF